MTTPHPHAEFFRAIADGEPLGSWEAKTKLASASWHPVDVCLHSLLRAPGSIETRRKPTPNVIDWSKLGRHVPVKVFNQGADSHIAYLEYFTTEIVASGRIWDHISLDTGLWVFNQNGVNPWPSGVVVELVYRPGDAGTHPIAAHKMHWKHLKNDDDIIASRFHSLEEGWSFGHE